MFSGWIWTVVVCAGGATPALSPESPTASPAVTSETPPRSLHAINQQLRKALRREATLDPGLVWGATVVELANLYGELVDDPRIGTSRTLESYRVKLRYRLFQIQRGLRRDLGRAQRGASHRVPDLQPTWSEVCRQVAVCRWVQAGAGSAAWPASALPAGGQLPRGGAPILDYGPHLIDLIQSTIDPDFWNVRGGPGSIAYYRMWYALVVRATGEVHGRVGGLTDRLRDER